MSRMVSFVRTRVAGLRAASDRGFISIWAMIIGTAVIIGFGGVLVDVGAALNARELAADVSRQAARAGADALAPASLRQVSPTSIAAYAPTAITAANRYLAEAGATGSVQVSGRQVTVHATVTRGTKLLSAIGIGHVQGSATATATALYGNGVTGGG
jgi:hypothetical protein